MEAYITTIDELLHDDCVIDIIYGSLCFVMDDDFSKSSFSTSIRDNLKTMRVELNVVIETEYIDKVYRDSYYNFFSTKLKRYNRNCVRLSFFEPKFSTIEEFMEAGMDKLRMWYDGFLVIRPLPNSCIGRNAISKRAKMSQGFEICLAPIKTTCIGAKLKVEAFPHSSQDAEYMSCAETTIWTILEYFGNKYTLYKPSLPTEVIDSLDSTAFKRLTPTTGLTIQQLSLALKKHDLSTIVYYKDNYSSSPEKFQELLNCYIESGFPVALFLKKPSGGAGHAVVCIGRSMVDRAHLLSNKKASNQYVCWNHHDSNIIVNDDNYPSYQSTPFKNPTQYYSDPYFAGMYISHFIVPLHCKIYLPAEIAIDASNYLVKKVVKALDGSCVKTFLTSNRSYREYLLTNQDFSLLQKQAYLQIEMPKFVWVTEVSTPEQFVKGLANAIILLDATGNNSVYTDLSQLIFLQFAGKGYIFNSSKRIFENFSLPLQPEFMAFKGNLK